MLQLVERDRLKSKLKLTGRRNNPVDRCPAVKDFIDYFIADYKYSQRLIIALLIRTELAQYGMSVTEKEEVRKLFLKFVDPLNPTHLTDEGMNRLNEYSSGGYDYLREKFDSKPYSVEEFLRSYTNLLREAIDQNSHWSEKFIN